MSWLGKALGGGIGFVLGGPLGAILGAMFGHALDEVAEDHLLGSGSFHTGPRQRFEQHDASGLSPGERAQMAFFVALFSLLAKMAKADGVVTKDEIKVIEGFMRDELRLSPQARRFAIDVFRQAKDSPYDHRAFALQLRGILQGHSLVLAQFLELLHRLAMADGTMHPAEAAILDDVAGIFGLRAQEQQRQRSPARPRKSTAQYYEVLGVSREDDYATVKKRHRELISEYHPDKIMAKGLPEEFVSFANQKLQAVNEAFDAIKKERGW